MDEMGVRQGQFLLSALQFVYKTGHSWYLPRRVAVRTRFIHSFSIWHKANAGKVFIFVFILPKRQVGPVGTDMDSLLSERPPRKVCEPVGHAGLSTPKRPEFDNVLRASLGRSC